MITRLTINNIDIDLTDDFNVLLNYSVADIKNPNKRKRSHSKTITLPGTRKNLQLFFNTYNASATKTAEFDFNPVKRLDAVLYRGDVVIFRGLWQTRMVRNTNGVYTIEGVIISRALSLFEALGDKMLADLNWQEYDHPLTNATGGVGTNQLLIEKTWQTSIRKNGVNTANFSGALSLPDGFGYYYGLTDWGLAANRATPTTHFATTPVTNPVPNWQHDELIPWLYLREVWDKIFTEAGFTHTGFILDNLFIKFLLIARAGGELPFLDATQLDERRCYLTGGGTVATDVKLATFTRNAFEFNTGADRRSEYISNLDGVGYKLFDTVYFGGAATTDALSQYQPGATGGVVLTSFGTWRLTLTSFNLKINVTTTFTENKKHDIKCDFLAYQLVLVKGQGEEIVIGGASLNRPTTFTGLTQTVTTNVTLTATERDFFSNEQTPINLRIRVFGQISVFDDANQQNVFNTTVAVQWDNAQPATEIRFDSSEGKPTTGAIIKLASFAPKMKCTEFITGVITMFNLMVDDVDEDNNYFVASVPGYYLNPVGALDWSNKVDKNKPVEVYPAGLIEGKFYQFTMANDTDAMREFYQRRNARNYGDKTYTVPTTWQTGMREFNAPFAVSPDSELTGTHDGVNPIRLQRIGVNDEATGVFKPFGKNVRIGAMALRSGTPASNWRLYNSSRSAFVAYSRYPGVHCTLGNDVAIGFEKPNEIYYDFAEYGQPVSNFYNLFWDKHIREITSPDNKILRCYVRLNDTDIANINFRQLIQIDGVIWKLNEVVDYQPGGNASTLCEFHKYINVEFDLPDVGTPPPPPPGIPDAPGT